MTTVLITGIGGSIGIDISRSLRRDSSIRIVGADGNPWGRRLGERLCDAVVDVPRADRDAKAYAAALSRVIADENVDFVFINPDPELQAVAKSGYLPPCAHATPPPAVTGVCLDKSATVAAAKRLPEFPQTAEFSSVEDLGEIFSRFTPPLWLRATVGPGGRGSLPVESQEEAAAWIRYWQKRGRADRWMIQELLPGRNYNWTGVYVDGSLESMASMERLKYFLGEPTVSGVSGQVSLCATVDPSRFERTADTVVRSLVSNPHGLYSVDLREDAKGDPKVTEVNPRLAGRPWLYTNAGVNIPLLTVRRFLGRPVGDAVDSTGFKIGLHLFRQLDVDPVFGEA